MTPLRVCFTNCTLEAWDRDLRGGVKGGRKGDVELLSGEPGGIPCSAI